MVGRRAVLSAGALLLAVLVTSVTDGLAAPSRTRPGRHDKAGIRGSELAFVQPTNVGVRVALVAGVPASPDHEAWAVGRSSAKVPGWAGEREGGQTVFLRHTRHRGWELKGPPLTAAGRPANPSLGALSIASNGEGWAVGSGGDMVRLVGGSWRMAPGAPTGVTLTSVSIGIAGGSMFGYASGDGPTVLRLRAGSWSVDESLVVPEDQTWSIRAIGAVSPDEAWAVGSSSRAVLVLRRTAAGWGRRLVGDETFDEAARPRSVSGTVVAATAASSVSATRDGAWVGGTIVPVDATSSLGDPAGDATRPFAMYFPRASGVTTFCPDRYTLGSDGRAATAVLCDEPLPLSAFGLTTMYAFPGANRGEAFAGGLGLFHYRNGAWFREPNPISYVSSIGFVNRTEGWIAGSGNAVGASGSFSSIQTVGHWTRNPSPSRMARWPQPMSDPLLGESAPLEGVAVSPDGSGLAIAVGQEGSSYRYRPGIGWEALGAVSEQAFHAVAWGREGAWAVGGRGTLYRFDGLRWHMDENSERLTTAALFSVATRDGVAYAVGANGTILARRAGEWSVDAASRKLTDADLFAVTAAGNEFVAAGADGVVLETRNGRWRRATKTAPLLSRGGLQPALYAADGLPDGTAFVGGESSSLLRRDGAEGSWRVDREGARVPPEGTILALAARRDGSSVRLLASVSYEQLKYSGENPSALTGFVLEGSSTGWRDVDYSTRLTTYDGFDASAPRDPVYAIAWDAGRAWAVGGTGRGNDDGQGHIQDYPTSSIYRVDVSGDPRPTGHTGAPPLDPSSSLVNFAYFGEAACGRGLCSATLGSGSKADVVALQIRDEINAMSRLPGGPKFVVFGGNMRNAGVPEELGQFKRYLDGFQIPVYGALGNRDLFSGLQASGVGDEDVTPDHSFYLDGFRDRPRPWGERAPAVGFSPVGDDPSTSGARTHYAFDYSEGGRKRMRVIVLDDSAPTRLTTASSQNPPRDQNTFLTGVLREARDLSLPAVIIMNRPAKNPLDVGSPRDSYDEALPVQAAAAQVGASAVLTSFFRENGVLVVRADAASTVPIFTFGGGGAPLHKRGDPPSAPDPALGFYHSWQLVSVDSARRTALGQYEVSVRSYPVVDTVSLRALDGVSVPGGNTLRFAGAGRAPDGGGPADPLQSRAAVVPMDFRSRGACSPNPRDGRNLCTGTGAVGPEFRFASEDPKIGYFVRPSAYDARLPYLDPETGLPVPDPTSGLFCAIGGGETFVQLISGFHRARMKIEVTNGSGPCTKDRIVVPPDPERPVPPRPRIPPSILEPSERSFRSFETSPIAIFPPPPLPIAAPAPPAAPGVGRKEEHEFEYETEASGDQDYAFTAARNLRERRVAAEEHSLWILGSVVLLAFFGAVVAAGVRGAAVPAPGRIDVRRRRL